MRWCTAFRRQGNVSRMIFAECFSYLAAKAWTPACSTIGAATWDAVHDVIEQFKSTRVQKYPSPSESTVEDGP